MIFSMTEYFFGYALDNFETIHVLSKQWTLEILLASKDLRKNNAIRARRIRLIDETGGQSGVMAITDAIGIARERGLDLVEVAPQSNPPVCRLLDYGKFRFEQNKRSKEYRKKQKQLRMKEIRMQPKIDIHDLEFKTKHIRQFLLEGSRVKVTIRFRGRELSYTQRGQTVLDRILEILGDDCHLDKAAAMEGHSMSMIVSPNTKNRKVEV